ncbi:MAG: polyprenyl synthetase family protein [Pseudonocardiaceae bacterium]
MTASGKVVRPALVLLSCAAVGGDPKAGLSAAVGVELVHNASLLHDDIIDGDQMRHGRPALWGVLGLPAAILAGDALFFLAMQVLAGSPIPLCDSGMGELMGAVQKLIEGEYTDTLLEDRQHVSLAECETMVAGKTGSLIVAACGLGALAGGASERQAAHLRAFGHHLGIAFQLVDDVLGIWGDPDRTGKPVRSDLRARKKTFPVVATLAAKEAASLELERLFACGVSLSDEEARRAVELIEAADGKAWAINKSEQHHVAALEHLRAARPAVAVVAELAALTEFIIGRDR